MKQLISRAAFTAAALLVGCTAPIPPRPSTDASVSPQQIVQALTNRKLTSRGKSDDGYGLTALKPYLRPLELRCQAEGGQLVPTAITEVNFEFRDANSAYHQARVAMPQRLGCSSRSETLWGVALRYNDTKFFPSSWAEEVFYYATIPMSFESGGALDIRDPNSPMNIAARIKAADDCRPLREQYAKQLHTEPRVGMRVQFGVITDVRLPLVQVQYDEAGRRIKGREQEWVQASTLSTGANCPQ